MPTSHVLVLECNIVIIMVLCMILYTDILARPNISLIMKYLILVKTIVFQRQDDMREIIYM